MDRYEWNDDEWIKQWISAGSGEEEDETLSSSSLSKKRQEHDDEWIKQWIDALSGEEEDETLSSSSLSEKRHEHDDEWIKQWISALSGEEEDETLSSSSLSKKRQEHDDEWISAGSGEEEDETLSSLSLSKKFQERMLRHAGVVRIMRRALPPSAKIAVDAKETVQECATKFVAYVTDEAAQRCKMKKPKIIIGDDIVRSVASLGFENYVEPLKTYLRRYREIQVDAADVDPKQGPARGKDVAEPSTSHQTSEEIGGAGNEMDWRMRLGGS